MAMISLMMRADVKMTPKRLDALRLRDAALHKVRTEGSFEVTNIGHCLMWHGEGLQISLRTPFNRIPPALEALKYEATLRGKRVGNLPYGLDIWDLNGVGKVLNIEWSDNGEVDFVSFRRGDWEAKIMAFEAEQ